MAQRYTTQQAYIPPVTDGVFRLLVVFCAAFIIEKIAFRFDYSAYPLILQFGPEFHPTQIFTHVFLNGSGLGTGMLLNDILHLFFQMIVIWSFGGELERLWGTYNFLRFFYVGILGGILMGALVHLIFVPSVIPGIRLYGCSAGIAAVMAGYAMLWPDRQVLFFFVIPLRVKWLIIILFVLYALFGNNDQIALLSGGALAGSLFILYYAKKGKMHSNRDYEAPAKPLRERWQDYRKKRRLKKKQAEINRRIEMKNEVDRLLEKISKQGMDSLSRKEKRFLDSASKEF